MSKNIAIFLDGTWNDNDNEDELSNVALLHSLSANDGTTQVSYYDPGVGTEWYDRKVGGLSGAGLSDNICQAYTYLCRNYLPGDRVFIFGFSRGAFTARSLSGLIYQAGLLPRRQEVSRREVEKLYESYREEKATKLEGYRNANTPCPIEFLGVWDTVGALGIPVGNFIRKGTARPYLFHDTKLSPSVKLACHAVAIDEKRSAFEPTLWEINEENKHRVKQVWFCGVHSDIGGGYPERHHSNVTLLWMIRQTQSESLDQGLILSENFDERTLAAEIDLRADIHDSTYSIFGIDIASESRGEQLSQSQTALHFSVQQKLNCSASYRPRHLIDLIEDVDSMAPFEIDEIKNTESV